MNVFDLAIAETVLAADFRDTQLDTKSGDPVFLIVVHETAVVSAFSRLIETIQRTDFDYKISSSARCVRLNGIRISVVSATTPQIRGETLIGAVLDTKALRDVSAEERSEAQNSLHIGMATMRQQGFPAALIICPVM